MYLNTLGALGDNVSYVTNQNADLVYGPGEWYVAATGAIIPKPGGKTYWVRFAKLMWGKTPEQLAANAIYRQTIEDTVKSEARRYSLLYKNPDFQGWFANRPEEYELFRRDYPEYPAIDTNEAKSAGQQYYDPYKTTEAMVVQENLKQQGYETAFNTRPNVAQPVPQQTNSVFTIGPGIPEPAPSFGPAPSQQPNPVISVTPIVPSVQSGQQTTAPAPIVNNPAASNQTNYSTGSGTIFEAGFPPTGAGSQQTTQQAGSGNSMLPLLGLAAFLLMGN